MMFSIIIPTYNRANIISRTVRSVIEQTYPEFEIIIVDDGSSDNTKDVIQNISDPRVRYIYKANEERSVARNTGAAIAKGEYLIFLDSDDRLLPDHLQKIQAYLSQQNFKPRFLFTGFEVLAEDGKTDYQYKWKGIFPPEKLFYGNYLGCSAVVVEKNLFDKYKFDTERDLVIFEDWHLWLRIISKEPLHCIPAGTVQMLNHEGRSVLNAGSGILEKKALCLRRLAIRDVAELERSVWTRRRLSMGLYSYLALHAALGKEKRATTLQFLVKALVQDPGLLTKRRFYAILKRLI